MPSDTDLIHVKLEKPLHLTARGAWLHGGEPFTNLKVAQLFSHSVIFDSEQNAWLVAIGNQRATFTFEDTPVFVEEIDENGGAHFTSRAFHPIPSDAYRIKVGSNDAWYLITNRYSFNSARLLPSLQQRLSGLVSLGADKLVIELPATKIKLTDE